jgi:uncharacterized protein YjiK
LVIAALLLPTTMASSTSTVSFSLTYLDRFKVKDDDERVAEPSGLVVSKEGDALWTVSDDRKSVFKISLEGDPLNHQSFKIGEKDLEGIALGPTNDRLVVVKEETNEILEVSLASKSVVARHALSAMVGFSDIERHFPNGDDKGLEGITFDQDRATFFVLKEANPAMMIELSKDLGSILEARVLDAAKGFVDDDVDTGKVDVSGLQYDQTRSSFWIVSDLARRLYLYDWDLDRVIQSAALGYEKDGDFREIEKAEGVAIDPRRHRLYVVSDEESRLYVFDLR